MKKNINGKYGTTQKKQRIDTARHARKSTERTVALCLHKQKKVTHGKSVVSTGKQYEEAGRKGSKARIISPSETLAKNSFPGLSTSFAQVQFGIDLMAIFTTDHLRKNSGLAKSQPLAREKEHH